MEAMGMLGLAKLAHATKNASYMAMSERPLSYTLAETTLFQADHGFRDGLPSFMALAAVRATHLATSGLCSLADQQALLRCRARMWPGWKATPLRGT